MIKKKQILYRKIAEGKWKCCLTVIDNSLGVCVCQHICVCENVVHVLK